MKYTFLSMKQLIPEDAAERIDLSQNPMDLRPAVEGLLRRVERVSQSLKPGQPLVILLGEVHNKPIDIAYQLMVLDALRKKYPHGIPSTAEVGNKGKPGSLVFNVELPHNSLEQMLESGFCRPVPTSLRGRIAAADQDAQVLLPAVLSARNFYFAPVSHHTLFANCTKHGISTRFTDAAAIYAGRFSLLDESDPWTASLIQHHATDLSGSNINITAQKGMHIRNIAMVEHALDSTPLLLIQQCGTVHMFGDKWSNFSYAESLSATFARAGAAVVPALITSMDFGIQNLPSDMPREMFENTLLIESTAEDRYCSGKRGEADYLRSIFQASGYDAEILRAGVRGNFSDPAVRKKLYDHVNAAIPALFEQAANTPPRPFLGLVPLMSG